MQVKISMEPDANAPEGAPEIRVRVVSKTSQGMSADDDVLVGKDNNDVEITIPEGGTLTLTAEAPPLVYDKEQMAAVPGEWPEDPDAEEPAPSKAAAPKPSAPKSPSATTHTSPPR